MKTPRVLFSLFVCSLLLVGCLGRSAKESPAPQDTPTAAQASAEQTAPPATRPANPSPTAPPTAVAEATPLTATATTSTVTADSTATPTLSAQDGEGSYASARLGYDDEYTSIPEVAAQAADLDYDPARCFAFVRDGVAFESYLGILRGARGTLWGRAGNAADQAVLLYALLRESGIEARFARGTLEQSLSQMLLQGMFTPEKELSLPDVAPSGLVADPLNDPALLSETADHLWVQMATTQGWIDLDPSFPEAQVGDRYTDPAATFAQPPDQLHHRLSVRARLERITPEGLKLSYPLEYEGPVSDMVGLKIEYGHILEQMGSLQGAEAAQIGRVIAAQQRRYQPVLYVGETGIVGDAFTEAEGLDLDAPVGRMAQALGDDSEEAGPLSGEWLEFTLTYPDGRQERIERAVFDRLGPSARAEGDLDRLARLDMTELLLSTHLSILVAPCDIPAQVAREQVGAAIEPLLIRYENLRQHLEAKRTAGVESETRRFALEALVPYSAELWMELAFAMNLTMASAADQALTEAADLLAVERYYDSARILITDLTSLIDGGTAFSLDLRRDTVRVLAHPGQDGAAEFAFRAGRGVFEAALEGEVLGSITGLTPVTAPLVFAEAQTQGIAVIVLSPGSQSELAELPLPKDARARISQALDAGYSIVVPESFVPLTRLDNEPRVAWWRVDPMTNEVVGVLDSGLHQAGTIMVNLLVTWGSDKLGGKICGYCDTAPLDILIGASVTLVDFAREIIAAVNATEDANKSIEEACGKARANIHDTAIQIAMATNKPEAVWRFELGANFAVPPVCR